MTLVSTPPNASVPETTSSSRSDFSIRRRRLVMGSQVLSSVGIGAVAVAGGLLAADLEGQSAAATALGALVLGSGTSAIVIGRLMEGHGRIRGLQVGYLVAATGAGVAVAATVQRSFGLLLLGTALIGAGNTAVMMSRYVAADLGPAHQRARTMSTSLIAVACGAVVGPLLLVPLERAETALRLPSSSGAYTVAALGFVAALAMLLTTPDADADVALVADLVPPDAVDPGRTRRTTALATRALGVLASANLTMVAMMAVYPTHLHHIGHSLRSTGLVISAHVASMYLASPFLGRWTDRYGPDRIVIAGAAAICTSSLLTAALPASSAWGPTGSLVILGVGWNAQIIAGSALLTGQVDRSDRPRLEARGELIMSIAAATAALLISPPLVGAGGIEAVAAATIPINAAIIAWTIASRRSSTRNALRR